MGIDGGNIDLQTSENDLTTPPNLDRAGIKERIKAIFDRRAAGDIEALLAFLSPDIGFFLPTTWSYASYPRTVRGREAVRELFHQRNLNYEILPSTIHRILVDGDRAIVHRTCRVRERGSGLLRAFDSIDLFRFRAGLVVEYSKLPDGSAREFVINYPH